ncbi:MAG: hypothetical protein JWP91_3758, partial [Fibrobacteres bacterium]|nr:hypothetical protein [Fibrobacterota bacterium]
ACSREDSVEKPAAPSPTGLNPAPIAGSPAKPLAAVAREADAPSHGGTITFQSIGAPGWYPSRRDPAEGKCDAVLNGQCCMAKHALADSALSPWNEELILTLRGPMLVKHIAVYQPPQAGQPGSADAAVWDRVSDWDESAPAQGKGVAFQGDGVTDFSFAGAIGNKCLVDVSSDRKFPCGPGSSPYCPSTSPSQRYGWDGSKLILVLASMPHFGAGTLANVKHCSTDKLDNWFDAPWMGLSHGELIRSGKFGGCNCYSKDPAHWELADGCGQFNVFETVNDNNAFRNLDMFSTNFFAYSGYVGEGPCGSKCDVSKLDPLVDLIDKATSREAAAALSTPRKGPGAAFRRPTDGFRWFAILMDVKTRTVQLAMVHPGNMPPVLAAMASNPPAQVSRTSIADLLSMRLPGPPATGIYRP